MTRKHMTSAFALTAALALTALPAFAFAASGPEIEDSTVHGSTVADDSYNTDHSTNADESYNSDSSTYSDSSTNVDDSFNSKVEDSNNDNRNYDTDVKVDDSFNSKVDDSNNTKVDDSYNSKVDDSNNTKVDDSYNSDSSTNDNSDHSTNNTEVRVALSLQDLDGSVSGFSFSIGGDEHTGGTLDTGDISNSGGAFAGFAGIQTASNNTGFAANNQAATAISANANVTFGNGGGH